LSVKEERTGYGAGGKTIGAGWREDGLRPDRGRDGDEQDQRGPHPARRGYEGKEFRQGVGQPIRARCMDMLASPECVVALSRKYRTEEGISPKRTSR